jgi:2-oxoisovalerate dehydrogenase E1 component
VHPLAVVTGNVIIGKDCYIGPRAVIRGDWGQIILEDGVNVQENCTIHLFPGKSIILKESAYIDHGAIIVKNVMIGMNSLVNASAELGLNKIIDLRTLYPLDEKTIINSVKKNGKCLVVTEESASTGFARALSGKIQEVCFKFLDAPVMTIGSENMPAIPLNSTLEQAMIPSTEKVKKKISEFLRY